jgi:hypothetical protein
MRRVRTREGTVDIRRLAFIGAQARLSELNAERQAILRAFHELSRSDEGITAIRASSDSARPARRRRRKISAEGRRRIAEAAKRRWAEWRKQNRARSADSPGLRHMACTSASAVSS